MPSPQIRAGRIFSAFMIKSWRVIRHPRVLIKPVANKGAGLAITLSDYAARERRVVGRRCPRVLQLHIIRPRATRQTKKVRKVWNGGTLRPRDTISAPRPPRCLYHSTFKFDHFVTVRVACVSADEGADAFN